MAFNSIKTKPNLVEIREEVQQLIMKTHSLDFVRIDISLRKERV